MFKLGIPTLVVKKFDVHEEARDGKYIEITGRASGFLSWLFTLMKLDTLTVMNLEENSLSFKSSSLSGEVHTVLPLAAIESSQCGFSKSISLLTFAAIALLFGISSGETGGFFLGLIIAAVFIALYFFSKRMFISVMAGGTTVQIAYKKGVIEGVEVDLDRTLSAIELLNKRILMKHAD